MNRRRFLIGSAQVGLGVLVAAALPGNVYAEPQARALGRLYKGTFDGQILESLDNGQTWQRVMNFGSHLAVWQVLEKSGQLYAEVGIQRYSFWLRSADARQWLTV